MLSSRFDLGRAVTLEQLSAAPGSGDGSVPYKDRWKYADMCSLRSKLFLAFVASPLKPKCQVCGHKGPCADRPTPGTKGRWNVAKGSPRPELLFSCLGLSLIADLWGRPPTPLTSCLWSRGPSQCVVWACSWISPSSEILEGLVLEQPSATRITLQPREGPQATQTSLRTA